MGGDHQNEDSVGLSSYIHLLPPEKGIAEVSSAMQNVTAR